MGKSRDYISFCDEMKKEISKHFSDGQKIEIHKVVKNNSIVLDGLVILSQNSNISPNFYLQHYYEEYKNGSEIPILAKQIEKLYYEGIEKKEEIHLDLSYENCKEKIVFRLVSLEKNEEIRKDSPYIPFLDMMIVFYVMLHQDQEGIGSIRINNTFLSNWEIDDASLFSLAMENTEKIFPMEYCSIFYMMKEIMPSVANNLKDEIENFDMPDEANVLKNPLVITNKARMNGAGVILYPDTLKRIAEELSGDFYLLPSSIHEFLAIPASEYRNSFELENMVREVNESCVSPEEFLSDSVYYYNQETETIEICNEKE